MKGVKRQSAGLLLYRTTQGFLEVLLIKHGGPFWKDKDAGVWSIPKGELEEGEMPLQTAQREFLEETGTAANPPFIELTPIVQKAGKQVYAWAAAGNLDAEKIVCNTFTMEWPPRSGKWQSFPEVDSAAWFTIEKAKEKINAAQVSFLEELVLKLEGKL